MTNTYGSNQKTVEEFIEYIRERLEELTKSWREIASAFAEAKDMFGIESDRFKRLCKETKFSTSKACKLASVASSERLKTHEKAFSAAQLDRAL